MTASVPLNSVGGPVHEYDMVVEFLEDCLKEQELRGDGTGGE